VGFIFTACNTHEKELALATQQKDSLAAVAFEKDQTINDFLGSFSEIQDNLGAITQKENAIAINASGNPEAIKTSKEVIKSQINDIKLMMDESKKQLSELSAKLKKSNIKLGKFEKMIASLNEQIAQKDKDLLALNEQVATLNNSVTTLKTSVDDLTIQNETKTGIISDQTTRLNTAYVAVGSSKELNTKKVTVKSGGLLGIGKTEKMEPNVNQEAFNTVDITKTNSIPVNAKDAKLVTTHPSDSYKLERDASEKVSDLVITDPSKFWSESKYLVVVTR
ncbi:MAG: hypothetical protein ACHQNT_06380, partial [Bacteroidia bacterium]